MASTASGPQTSASRANSSRFSSRSSGAASITRSQPPRSSSSPARRAARVAASASAASLQRPRCDALRERRRAAARARARAPPGPGRGGSVSKPPSAGELRDPGAHRPGADDADPLDATLTGPGTRGGASRGRPACPRPGPRSPSRARTGAARARARRVSAVSSAASTACLASRAASGGRSATVCGELDRLRRASRRFAGDLVDEPEPQRLLGVEAAAGQHQLHRPLLADHAREALGAAAAGDDPERDLGLAELGRLGGDDHVAEQRQLAAAAEREARDGGDQRRAARGDAAARTRPPGGTSASWKLRSRIALMSAPAANTSSEPAITMQRTSGSASKRSSCGGELLHQLGRERVARLGPVQPAAARRGPSMLTSRRAALTGSARGRHRVDPGRVAADDQLLDLRGALVEGRDAGVAQVALDRVVVDVAGAAVDLDREVRALDRRLGRVELRDRGLDRVRLALRP